MSANGVRSANRPSHSARGGPAGRIASTAAKAVGFPLVELQDAVVRLLMPDRRTHRLLLGPGIEPYRWVAGRWRAWRTFERARRRVPAYERYLADHPKRMVRLRGLLPDLGAIPETDKRSYIQPNQVEDVCVHGRLPTRGVVVDESSGSSGTPTNWARGRSERRATTSIMRATFHSATRGRPVFVINAFALGAWATGMNVSMSLADVCMIKSTGPDLDKIVSTMTRFGPNYSYVVMGYPPFLQRLGEESRLQWRDYDAAAVFGGEGISERMRERLHQAFRSGVLGSYGASDLEINIAAENAFTVALRRELEANGPLREELTRTEHHVLPMVFQYNPFDYVIETNDRGELLITVCRGNNLSPRVRYNIHDLGHTLRLRDLVPILARHGAANVLEHRILDLPLLFHYGRSDLSIDFQGAVLSPETVREVLDQNPHIAPALAGFRLISYEDRDAAKRLLLAIELREGARAEAFDQAALEHDVLAVVRARNQDFDNACRITDAGGQPRLRLFGHGTGPFARDADRLKHQYVAHLDHAEAHAFGVIDETT
jgi:phenylacetate-CoA ligase